MSIRVNPEAVEFADQEIGLGHYRISTVWREAQPTDAARAKFLETHGWAEYVKWFLGEDTSQPEQTTARLVYPTGDFKSIHRSGLIAARDHATQAQVTDVAEAADELLFFFDRISAC